MKMHQCGREQDKDGQHVEPKRKILREKQSAERHEKPEQRDDLEVPHGVRLQQFQRHQQEQAAQPRLDAHKRSIGQQNAAEADAKEQHLSGE